MGYSQDASEWAGVCGTSRQGEEVRSERGQAVREWYAIRSKPKKEATTATFLRHAGIEVYLPQIRVRKPASSSVGLEPFFPGYLFCRVDSSGPELSRVNYTPGVLYVLGYGNEPSPVPETLIAALQHRLNGKGSPYPTLKAGERVVITAGPLRGIEAIFAGHLSGNGRVQVLIQLLKRQCRTEVHLSQVRRVEQAVGKVLSVAS